MPPEPTVAMHTAMATYTGRGMVVGRPKPDTDRKHCPSPAMKNGRCRMHGGPSTEAPKGNQNAYKHGRVTAEAIARRREVADLLRAAREILNEEKICDAWITWRLLAIRDSLNRFRVRLVGGYQPTPKSSP